MLPATITSVRQAIKEIKSFVCDRRYPRLRLGGMAERLTDIKELGKGG